MVVGHCWVQRTILEALKAKGLLDAPIEDAEIWDLIEVYGAPDHEMVLPLDLRSALPEDKTYEDMKVLLEDLGAKAAAEAFIKASELSANGIFKPMTAKEWRIMVDIDDDEEDEEDGEGEEEEEDDDEELDEFGEPPQKKAKKELPEAHPQPAYQLESEDFKAGPNVCVVGLQNAGKSKWVNKIRGLKGSKSEGWAPVGAGEVTLKPTSYAMPGHKGIHIWDVPGSGTADNPIDEYFTRLGIQYFNAVVVMFDRHFPIDMGPIVRRLAARKIPCAVVRNKIDVDVDNEMEDNDLTEREVLKNLRKDLSNAMEALMSAGAIQGKSLLEPDMIKQYLVSSSKVDKFDFEMLKDWVLANMGVENDGHRGKNEKGREIKFKADKMNHPKEVSEKIRLIFQGEGFDKFSVQIDNFSHWYSMELKDRVVNKSQYGAYCAQELRKVHMLPMQHKVKWLKMELDRWMQATGK